MLSGALTLALLTLATPDAATAQGRGRSGTEPTATVTASLTISLGDRERILTFYATTPPQGIAALPPGVRRNLERGKALPPGIAKRSLPERLQSQVTVPVGFEIMEVGLDVLLVEVATGVIHDVLMDIIR